MAHHQHHQADGTRRGLTVQSILNIFNLSNTPTVPLGDDELSGDADEPPDDQVSPLTATFQHHESIYKRSRPSPENDRRESLLTRALMASHSEEHEHPPRSLPRGLSTTSSHSTASMASTAELTSDGNLTSPPQSNTPSPSFPATHFNHLPMTKGEMLPPSRVLIVPETKDDLPSVAPAGEAAIEKTLGRKRCIMFACGGKSEEKPKEVVEPRKEPERAAQPPKRKCMLTFACPTRASKYEKRQDSVTPVRRSSPTPESLKLETGPASTEKDDAPRAKPPQQTPVSPLSRISFHEFGSSTDEPDAWVDHPTDYKRKLTLTDCMKKEYAIRQLGEEAEEEAQEEEQEEDELEDELEEETSREDDFAPSDDSDGGNDSDDEAGFAESDEESDAGSDYQFWAPSTTTAATSTENVNISHFSSRQRSTASSPESTPPSSGWATHHARSKQRAVAQRLAKMRPSTPELPDSTDFVCGTLDEDRPLEQAYISCREQRKRDKHVPIPQDIDPSFPTTDPEDNDDDDDVDADQTDEHLWLKDQLDGFEEENGRGRRKTSTVKASPVLSPRRPAQVVRPTATRPTFNHAQIQKHNTHRSPPPKTRLARSPPPKVRMGRSPPPPRRLFGHSPSRLRSPPPAKRLNSPRGSPDFRQQTTVGLNVGRLAQRPNMGRTASLPRTPNPFFRNYSSKDLVASTVTSGAVSPGGGSDQPRPDMHVRGPVDIVAGLENKRQKRKEKYWRQHCRKAAKEQAQRKPCPGRGAERMRELGLECAERARGYGIGQLGQLGQPAQLVLSL